MYDAVLSPSGGSFISGLNHPAISGTELGPYTRILGRRLYREELNTGDRGSKGECSHYVQYDHTFYFLIFSYICFCLGVGWASAYVGGRSEMTLTEWSSLKAFFSLLWDLCCVLIGSVRLRSTAHSQWNFIQCVGFVSKRTESLQSLTVRVQPLIAQRNEIWRLFSPE